MSDIITQDSTAILAEPVIQPGDAWLTDLERRRPDRNDNASTELVALMRKPTTEARLRIMLYDAPNFVLPQASSHRRNPYHTIRMMVAVATCSLVWALAFRGMMLLWG